MQNAVKISKWLLVNNHLYYHAEDFKMLRNRKTHPFKFLPINNLNYFLYYVQGLYLAVYKRPSFPDKIKKGWKDIYLPTINRAYKYGFSSLFFDEYHTDLSVAKFHISTDEIRSYQEVENDAKLSTIVHAVVDQLAMQRPDDTYSAIVEAPVRATKIYRTIQLNRMQNDFQRRIHNYEFHHVLYEYLHIPKLNNKER